MRTTTMLANTLLAVEGDPLDEGMQDASAVRAIQAGRRMLRDQLMQLDDGRVRVAFRIHLLEPAVERVLRQRLASCEDTLALTRHGSDLGDGRRFEAANLARLERDRMAEALSEATVAADVTLAGLRPAGADWVLSDVPLATIEQAHRVSGVLRAELVAVVETLIEADLVRVRSDRHTSTDGIVDLELLEHDADSVGRVRAFAEQVAEAQRVAIALAERLRSAALSAAPEQPREWLVQSLVRRRRARHSLDAARATQAAIAELQSISELGVGGSTGRS